MCWFTTVVSLLINDATLLWSIAWLQHCESILFHHHSFSLLVSYLMDRNMASTLSLRIVFSEVVHRQLAHCYGTLLSHVLTSWSSVATSMSAQMQIIRSSHQDLSMLLNMCRLVPVHANITRDKHTDACNSQKHCSMQQLSRKHNYSWPESPTINFPWILS